MTNNYSSNGLNAPLNTFQVERPRATDAITGALRDAYGEQATLPEDMLTILHRLDGQDFRRGY